MSSSHNFRSYMHYLNPYELHKIIINQYVLKCPGDTKLLNRDYSKDRNDYHVLKENHRFLWDKEPETWEEEFAKKYYEKLFKEYCIADLSRYKENKVALRWRIEREVVSGKGQFLCGNKLCSEKEDLRSWEVNFAYLEQGEKKNALVKIRLCPSCSKKLNYYRKKKEVIKLKRIQYKGTKEDYKKSRTSENNGDKISSSSIPGSSEKKESEATIIDEADKSLSEDSPWEEHKPAEIKSREEEMEDYLQDLLI